MKNYLITLLVSVILLSCSGSNSILPNQIEPARSASVFNPAIHMFGGPGPGSGPCRDSDIATVVNGPGSIGTKGSVWEDGDGKKWSVVVALRDRETIPPTSLGFFKFIPEDAEETADLSPGFATGFIGRNLNFKIDACYFYDDLDPGNPERTFVEVCIVYQWAEAGLDNYKIIIMRYGFHPSRFVNGTPDEYDWIAVNVLNYQAIMPDVAYLPTTGELTVVMSTDYDPVHEVRWARGYRNPDYPMDVIMSSIYLAQPANDPYNGWTPRIDIGKITFAGFEDDWVVGVAYTGTVWVGVVTFYCTRVSYWDATALPHNAVIAGFRATDQVYGPELDAGLPTIDIGPPGEPYGCIAFVQTILPGNYNYVVATFADSRSYLFTPLQEDLNYATSPSVSIHPDWGDDTKVSVSYLASVDGFTWNPRARYINIQGDWPNSTVTKSNANTISNIQGHWSGFGFMTDYTFRPGTSMVAYDENRYWTTWTKPINGDPREVWGALGFIEP